MKRRKLDITDAVEFGRAVSLIMDKISSVETSSEDLSTMLAIQNDLLRLTLTRIQKDKAAHDK